MKVSFSNKKQGEKKAYFSVAPSHPCLHILLRVKKWEITITAIITTTAARERKRALKYAKRPRM